MLIALSAVRLGVAADPLEPSLKFLETVSRPMPDFRKVTFYKAVPDSGGTLKEGIGGSRFVRPWFTQMEQTVGKFTKLDDKLGTDVEVYADTVKEEGQKVLASRNANFRDALAQLNKATDGRVFQLLDEYRREVKQINDARARHKIAEDEAEAASFGLDASAADEKECALLLKREALEADRAAIERKLKQSRELLDAAEEAITAAAGGPKSFLSYVGAKVDAAQKQILLELLYAAEQEQLLELGAKIEAIDKVLKENRCQAHKARLTQAKANLQAKMKNLVLRFGQIPTHRANAWSIIDQLAALEKGQRGMTFFQQLQNYNKQANHMGVTMFDSLRAYQAYLTHPPVSRGELMYDLVQEDISRVKSEKRDKTGEWTTKAEDLRAYLGEYHTWHKTETDRVSEIMEELRAGRHLHFVDSMVAEASKLLGATVTPEHIIR